MPIEVFMTARGIITACASVFRVKIARQYATKTSTKCFRRLQKPCSLVVTKSQNPSGCWKSARAKHLRRRAFGRLPASARPLGPASTRWFFRLRDRADRAIVRYFAGARKENFLC